mgnify:CR=1 FL=1
MSQKAENLLNLALDATSEEREKITGAGGWVSAFGSGVGSDHQIFGKSGGGS